ncbi:ABC transporter permease [Nonomuraea cavernae]|uniref:ABC transporter permease n=1 Tax=Nonomuraea cavernae TaxID=2045107 RepID=A0A917YQ38_9ACTN|nr:ABC transporter permease [Nonomuraea cavernae]MCA2184463.1 ABC transporter permease [Nonomuraea cavernae]GGO63719.1 ABC transporter permease [Nonomuraea cavernae]
MRLIRAELLKLTTTRLWWVMLAVTIAYALLQLGITIGFAGVTGGQPGAPAIPGRDTAPFQELMWGLGASGAVFPMILGVVMMTAEYRYQTITSTFLTTPRRERVVAGKLGAGVVVGLVFGLVVLALTAVAVVITVPLAGGELSFTGSTARIVVGTLAVLMLYTLFGIGIGALIRNQLGAIVAAVAWVFVIEAIVSAIPALRPVGRWTPGGAATALTNSGVDLGLGTDWLLPAWAGGVVLLGYALVFAAVASATTLRRDIT